MDSKSVNSDNSRKRGLFYGWIVVMAAFFITGISCGTCYGFGVFVMPMVTELGWTRGAITGAVLVMGLTYAATVPFAGWLADRYGFRLIMTTIAVIPMVGLVLTSQVQAIWQLYLFYGFVVGCGAAIGMSLPFSIVSRWFIRRQGTALGIVSSGIGIGTALLPLLFTCLISEYGWRMTFCIAGVLSCFVCVSASFLVMRNPEDSYLLAHEGREEIPDGNASRLGQGNSGLSLTEAVSTISFWLLFTLYALCILGLGLIMIHLVPYALDMGLSAMTAASLLTTIGVCSIIGRLASGATSDRVHTKSVLVVCLAIQLIVMLSLPAVEEVWMLYLVAALFGISYGGYIPLIPKLTSELFGTQHMGAIFGTLMVADGIGFGIGPWLAGYLFDTTGSYHISFLCVAVGIAIAIILTLLLRTPGKNAIALSSMKH